MSKITIEFFHDVICSFCFPMSYRMRRLQEMMPDVEIVHRSFALFKSEAGNEARSFIKIRSPIGLRNPYSFSSVRCLS